MPGSDNKSEILIQKRLLNILDGNILQYKDKIKKLRLILRAQILHNPKISQQITYNWFFKYKQNWLFKNL